MSELFKLLVPASYGNKLKISGPLGATPDIGMVGGQDRCARSTLPSLLDQWTFQVIPSSNEVYKPPPTAILTFYHLGDFFVVSDRMRDLLDRRLGKDALQVQAIDMRYQDGSRVPQPYFALKVVHTIDCIDAAQSFCTRSFMSDEHTVPFAEMMDSYTLAESLAPEFSNAAGGTYRSFPPFHRVGKVGLIDSAIPSDAALFRPAFWPACLLVHKSFAETLSWACEGGAMGYYFWTLDLENVSRSYRELMHALQ